MKLKKLLNEIGFIGVAAKSAFVKEQDDWYGDDDQFSDEKDKPIEDDWYGDDDQFDQEEDTERITAIYSEGSELLDDVGMQLEMFSEQIDENLEQLYDTSGDMVYKQQKGVVKKYFNNILRNIELTKKHLDAGF